MPWTWGLKWHYEPSAAADFGTAVHSAAEALAMGREPDFSAICKDLAPSERVRVERCAAQVRTWLAEQEQAEREAEAAFAYNVAIGEARVVKMSGPRDYSDKRPGEIMGTADLVWHGQILTVDDYKTGRRENVEPAATNMQVRFLGLAAARAFGVNEVRVRLVFVSEDGIEEDVATFDELDLCEIAAELATMAGKLHGRPEPNPGGHCKYCPVALDCPATKATLARLDAPMSIEITSPEHAASTLHRLRVAKDMIDRIERAVKDYVRQNGPIPTGNGTVYKVVEASRETIDLAAPGAYQALVRILGDAAQDAVDLSTTKAAIHKAAPTKALEEAVYAELRQLGAIRTTTFEKLSETKKAS